MKKNYDIEVQPFRLYRLGEVSQILDINRLLVRELIEMGKLRARHTGRSGSLRVPGQALIEFCSGADDPTLVANSQ